MTSVKKLILTIIRDKRFWSGIALIAGSAGLTNGDYCIAAIQQAVCAVVGGCGP